MNMVTQSCTLNMLTTLHLNQFEGVKLMPHRKRLSFRLANKINFILNFVEN